MNKKLRSYLYEISTSTSVLEKQKLSVWGLSNLFYFNRAALFTYSSINKRGEGVLLLNYEKESSFDLKDNFSEIPVFHSAIESRKAQYFTEKEVAQKCPQKYIEKFNIFDLYVIPICSDHSVIGLTTVRYPRDPNFSKKECLHELTLYGQFIGEHFKKESIKNENLKQLSKREIEVLQRMAWGETTKIMADRMAISEYTVSDYIKSVFRKLKVENRAHAIAEAMRKDFIF